ncbi:MAG: IPT/TIG domain-containing protein, partial [Terriglobales bacterium]
SSISPASGSISGGTGVTITGTGFLSGATVSIGGTATGVNVVSSTSITATTAAHSAGSVNVVVTNSDSQTGTLTNGYSYTNPPPSVTSISPASGPATGGTSVTITGTGFLSGATVSIGGTAANGVTVVSGTSITATTPAHAAGTATVVVTNSDGQNSSLKNGYTYAANPAPTVTSINPGTGPTSGGTGLTITGANFVSGATVTFGGTPATGVTVAGSTSITATAPSHAAGTVDVVVTNPDGQAGTLGGGYIYSAAEASLGLGVPYGDSNSATIAAGQTASYTLSIGGEGMSGTASLSCTGVPASASCSLPGSLAFNATTPTTFTIKVATTARVTSALPRPAFPTSMPASWLWTLSLGMLFVPGAHVPRRSLRRWRRYLWFAPVLLLLFVTASCGGGGSMGNAQPQQTGTPAGTYNVIVKASSNSKTGSTTLTLNVQ